MSLENLDKELYDPDSEIEKRGHRESEFDPEISKSKSPEEFEQKEEWIKEKKRLTDSQKKIIKWGLIATGAILLIAAVIFFVVKYSAFSEEKVAITIEGPQNVESTQLADFTIRYKNDNRIGLKDAYILLNYAENFLPESTDGLQVLNNSNSRIEIGTIEGRSEGEIKLKGKFYAPQDYTVYIRATLNYVPSNFNSVFQTKGQLGVNVRTSPIFLEISAPLEAASGNDVEYFINYKNLSSRNFNDARVKIEYPDGFSFTSANPEASEGNNFWYIGDLEPGKEGSISILGKLSGSNGQSKAVKTFIGSVGEKGEFVLYTENEKITKIVSSPLTISQLVDNIENLTVSAGDRLNYILKYRNEGNIAMTDVIVTLEIKSDILDFSGIGLNKGYYDSSKDMIIWKASDYPGLVNIAPGTEGEISFEIPVLARIPVKDEDDKNFTITTVAKIDSPDIPTPLEANKIIYSDTLELKLNSKVILETSGYHKDENIENFGSLPPKVGKETSYAMHWQITNVSSDISDARIASSLPTGVKWTGKIFPEGEKVTYNERTNEVIWDIGKIDSGTGILDSKREVAFQVAITPQVNQVGKEAPLLNKSFLRAKDLFTSEEVNVEGEEKTTLLREDSSVGNKYQVVD